MARALEGQGAGDPSTQTGPPGLSPGESATISLIDQSGAQFTYGVTLPSTFGEKAVVNV